MIRHFFLKRKFRNETNNMKLQSYVHIESNKLNLNWWNEIKMCWNFTKRISLPVLRDINMLQIILFLGCQKNFDLYFWCFDAWMRYAMLDGAFCFWRWCQCLLLYTLFSSLPADSYTITVTRFAHIHQKTIFILTIGFLTFCTLWLL